MQRSLAAAVLAATFAGAAHAATFKVMLIVPADDPRLARDRVERAVLGHIGGPVADAFGLAIKDGGMELEASGASMAYDVVKAADLPSARSAAIGAEQAGMVAIATDLPAGWTLAVSDAVKVPVINIATADERLRGPDCRRNLLHAAPGERMRADALAQTLVARKWSQVLMLVGPTTADAERSTIALASLRRYGLKVVNTKGFKLSADPRQRDFANTLLLTQGTYDVVWVVDSDGEFGQMLPYRTAQPRPVVGDGGLVPTAWSGKYERYGAPQVTRSLVKLAGRRMEAYDWAAYIAGKALVAAAAAAPKGPKAAFAKALSEVEIDGSKGTALSFRPWTGNCDNPSC